MGMAPVLLASICCVHMPYMHVDDKAGLVIGT